MHSNGSCFEKKISVFQCILKRITLRFRTTHYLKSAYISLNKRRSLRLSSAVIFFGSAHLLWSALTDNDQQILEFLQYFSRAKQLSVSQCWFSNQLILENCRVWMISLFFCVNPARPQSKRIRLKIEYCIAYVTKKMPFRLVGQLAELDIDNWCCSNCTLCDSENILLQCTSQTYSN